MLSVTARCRKIEVKDFPAFIVVNDKGEDFFAVRHLHRTCGAMCWLCLQLTQDMCPATCVMQEWSV
jgi:hypothetical protein